MAKYRIKCPCCDKMILFDTLTEEAVHLDDELKEKEDREKEIRLKRVDARMQAQMKALMEAEKSDPIFNDPFNPFDFPGSH